jgi:hypothetical protein
VCNTRSGACVYSIWNVLDKPRALLIIGGPGMNPLACKAAIEQTARDAGLPVPRVAAVTG